MKMSSTLLCCGTTIAPENWTINSVPTPYRLYFIKGGKAYFRVGKKEFQLKHNHFYLFPSSLPFLAHQDTNDRLNHIYFNFLLSTPIIASEPICCSIDDHPLFEHFLKLIEPVTTDYYTTKSPAACDIASSLLDALLKLILEIKPINFNHSEDIFKVIEYIELHYKEKIQIKDMASSMYLSEDYFIRKFKKVMGMTPYAYLSRLRISIATELLKNGMSMTDVATATGFEYVSSLSNALKRYDPYNKKANL